MYQEISNNKSNAFSSFICKSVNVFKCRLCCFCFLRCYILGIRNPPLKSYIYCEYGYEKREYREIDTGALLSSTQFFKFYFSYVNNYLEVGRLGGLGSFIKENISCPGNHSFIGVGSEYFADWKYCKADENRG